MTADTRQSPPRPGRLVPIARRRNRPVCVMIPGAGGGIVPYLRLGGVLGRTHDVYAVRAAGLVPDEEPESSIQEMARGVLDALEPGGLVPDVVFGWSMGGTIAWEVCVALAGRGVTPDLVLVDSSPFRRPPQPERDDEIRDLVLGMLGPRPDDGTRRRVLDTFAAHAASLTSHEATAPYAGRVLLLVCDGASDLVDVDAALARWRALAPRLVIGSLAADHFAVFEPEHLPQLSGAITEFLGTAPR